ncbi:VOC family protein [Actinocorallia libanotica]|uniref:VOC family protein n=1 Tax=Actinocorallia libanotica TaxID=46162 RepID=UPI0031DEB70D
MSVETHDRVDVVPPEGTPSWLELSVPDPGRARAFYGTLFDWTFEDDLCLLDGLPVAAIRALGEGRGEAEWTVFFATDDCDGAAGRVSAAGGRIVLPPYEDGTRGRAAVVTDVLGARFGLWQGADLVGTRLVNGYGTFIFNELPTAERERALGFYREVFDYRPSRHSDVGDLVRPDGHTVASIVVPHLLEEPPEPAGEETERYLAEMKGSVDLPPLDAWVTYFAVEDVHEVLRHLTGLGGWTHPQGPQELPWGCLASARDPLGAAFHLVEPWDLI